MTNYSRYLGLLIATFPALREALKDEEGIHLKTHVFVDYANAAISRRDWATLKECYAFMDRILHEEPDYDVHNAVYVSFVEHLDFHTDPAKGKEAKKLLPKRLLQAWNELDDY